MKRILSILTLLCVSLSICAYDFIFNGIAYNIKDNNKVEVTKYETKYCGDITIPEKVESNGSIYNVTSIGDYAFEGCGELTSVAMPNSVTSIGNEAFRRCRGLTSITIPNSVTIIGVRAFYDCSSLISISIPNSVMSIGNRAFVYCINLPVENNIRYADTYAIEAVDKALTTYTLREGTRFIGSEAFKYCSRLTSITIPNSVTSIGSHAFSDCGLSSITIPNSVTSIGMYAFEHSKLSSITIPNSITSINNGTFYYCDNLTSITLPDNLIDIRDSAFCRCESLSSITIPNSVTSIGNNTFVYSGLSSITLSNSLKSIGKNTFSCCFYLTSIIIPNSVTSIGDYAFNGCALSSVTLSNSLETIARYAFQNCPSLTTIVLPKSVTYLGEYAFGTWGEIESVTSLNPVPPSTNGTIFQWRAKQYSFTLYVPKGCKDKYSQQSEWGKFKNIIELEGYDDDSSNDNQSSNDDSNQGSETSKSRLLTINYDNGTDAKYKMDDISSISITPKQASSENGSAVKLEYGETSMTLSLGQKPQIVNEGDNIILKTNSMTITLSVPCKATFVDISDTSIDKVVLRNNEEDKPIDVFTIDGRKVTTLKGKNETLSLEKGVYIINGKKMVIK